MQIGQLVSFSVDALGGVRLKGHVLEIAPATGSEFSVLKADNATGNFTKVVQRLPIKIAIDEGQADAARLRPGMSVIVRLDTAQKVEHSAQTHQAIEANLATKPQAPAVSASEQAKP